MQIVCYDFDGVIHSYASGWKGATNIPDDPVPGAIESILEILQADGFEVAIFSSRSHQWGGRRAMKRWLRHHLWMWAHASEMRNETIPMMEFRKDSWNECADYWAKAIIRRIKWPLFKPPASIIIDDRAWRFTGTFPPLADLPLTPWNKHTKYQSIPTANILKEN